MLNNLTKYLVIVLILSLGFGQLLRFDWFGLPIYLHDALVLLVLLLLFLQGQALQVRKFDLRGLALLGAGLTLGYLRALTLYPLSDLLVPSLYTLRLLAYLTLYFFLKNSKIPVSKIYFLTSGSIALIIGLGQYFFMPDMRVFQYLGWDDHLSRLTLPHFDPTFSAVMLALFALSIAPKLWYFGILVFLPILLTYSRSVWLSLILTFSFFMIKNKKFKFMIIGICLLIIPILFLPKKFGEGTNLLRTFSIESRFNNDLSIIRDQSWNLITGIGMHKGPNNSYLYLLATTGVLGLIGWGTFMFSLYTKSAHKPMLTFFFLASLFNNVMFYPFALLWVLLIESKAPRAT